MEFRHRKSLGVEMEIMGNYTMRKSIQIPNTRTMNNTRHDLEPSLSLKGLLLNLLWILHCHAVRIEKTLGIMYLPSEINTRGQT